MKYVIPFLLFVSISGYSQGLKFGFNASYLVDQSVPFNNPLEGYHLLQLHGNTQYYINPRHSVGLQYIHILTSGSSYTYTDDKAQYFMFGTFYQFDILPNSLHELFPEVGLLYGNYCPCGKADPVRVEDLVYLSYGFGGDINLGKGFYLDLGLHWYNPVFNIPANTDIWATGQYVLGIGYIIK